MSNKIVYGGRKYEDIVNSDKFHIGDTYEINVPLEIGWKVKTFEIVEIYKDFCLLSDGIINVCYNKFDLLKHNKRNPIIGCWN